MMSYSMELIGRFEIADSDSLSGVKAWSSTMLKAILKLYFGLRLKGVSTMKKTDAVI
jgi:hypothetical protein